METNPYTKEKIDEFYLNINKESDIYEQIKSLRDDVIETGEKCPQYLRISKNLFDLLIIDKSGAEIKVLLGMEIILVEDEDNVLELTNDYFYNIYNMPIMTTGRPIIVSGVMPTINSPNLIWTTSNTSASVLGT